MQINNALGLLTAILGLTTTIHGGWKYLSSSERTKKERISAVAIVVVIMGVVLGAGFGISHATEAVQINGQKTIPIPFVATPTPAPPQPTPVPNFQDATPTSTHGATPTVTTGAEPSPTVTPKAEPSSAVTPEASPSPAVTPIK